MLTSCNKRLSQDGNHTHRHLDNTQYHPSSAQQDQNDYERDKNCIVNSHHIQALIDIGNRTITT